MCYHSHLFNVISQKRGLIHGGSQTSLGLDKPHFAVGYKILIQKSNQWFSYQNILMILSIFESR